MKAFVRSACRAALKRALWASLLSIVVMLAGAEEVATSRSGQGAAGLWFDIAPLVELTNRPALSPSDSVSAEDLEWFYARPAFATLGFQLRTGPLFAAMSVELQQDVGELLLGGSLTNLQFPTTGTRYVLPIIIRTSAFLREKGRVGIFRSVEEPSISAPATIR